MLVYVYIWRPSCLHDGLDRSVGNSINVLYILESVVFLVFYDFFKPSELCKIFPQNAGNGIVTLLLFHQAACKLVVVKLVATCNKCRRYQICYCLTWNKQPQTCRLQNLSTFGFSKFLQVQKHFTSKVLRV